MKFLGNIIAFITQAPREKVDIEWTKSWTGNIFRFWEMCVGRRHGIRAEAALTFWELPDGKIYPVYQFYTFESVLTHLEDRIRNFFNRIPQLAFKKIYLPQFAPITGFVNTERPYVLAIAFVGVQEYTGSTSLAVNVGAGSNRFLAINLGNNGGGVTSITYASNAMTTIVTNSAANVFSGPVYGYGMKNPTSGSNTVAISFTGTNIRWTAAWYTGVDQTTGYENANTADNTGSLAITRTHAGWATAGGASPGAGWALTTGTLRTAQNTEGNIDSNATGTSTYTFVGTGDSVVSDWTGYNLIEFTASGPANWKTYNTITVASNLKTLNTNTLANIKTYDTIS